jgi:hypothetical protein
MADGACAYEREEDVVVLLALEAIHGRHLVRHADEGIPHAAPLQHVSDQVLLPVVRGEDGDLVRRVAHQPHVHEHRHCVLSLSKVLQRGSLVIFAQLPQTATDIYWGNHSYRTYPMMQMPKQNPQPTNCLICQASNINPITLHSHTVSGRRPTLFTFFLLPDRRKGLVPTPPRH